MRRARSRSLDSKQIWRRLWLRIGAVLNSRLIMQATLGLGRAHIGPLLARFARQHLQIAVHLNTSPVFRECPSDDRSRRPSALGRRSSDCIVAGRADAGDGISSTFEAVRDGLKSGNVGAPATQEQGVAPTNGVGVSVKSERSASRRHRRRTPRSPRRRPIRPTVT